MSVLLAMAILIVVYGIGARYGGSRSRRINPSGMPVPAKFGDRVAWRKISGASGLGIFFSLAMDGKDQWKVRCDDGSNVFIYPSEGDTMTRHRASSRAGVHA